LGLASLLALGVGCRRWTVVSISLHGLQNITDIKEIKTIRVHAHELVAGSIDTRGFDYNSAKDTDDAFRMAQSVSVYLPIDVHDFFLQVWALDEQKCLMSGSRDFHLDTGEHPTMALDPQQCVEVADGGDAHPDSIEAPADSSDLAEAPIEVAPVAATDAADCGIDVSPVVVCTDPTGPDAGAPDPFPGTVDPRCEPYCTDMLAACKDSFTDQAGCLATCSQAGWASSDDLGSGMTTLSCLERYARIARDNMSTPYGAEQCDIARPSGGMCNSLCKTYCNLRLNLCRDDASAAERCADECQAIRTQSPNVVPCLIDTLTHDVVSDRRYCSWTALTVRCGRCSAL
jgi:hypothetical protein